MDFGALVNQYKNLGDGGGEAAAEQSPEQPLAKGGRHRAARRDRFRPRESPLVTRLGDGEYKLENMHGVYDLWEDEWVTEPDDVVVLFKAKASNDVTVLLTVDKRAVQPPVYEVVLGGWNNSKSVIRTECQGIERACSLEPRMCSANVFISYWVALKNGMIAVGTGEKPGLNTFLAWSNPQHDPDDVQPCWVSFTSWDSTMILSNVRVCTSSQLDHDWLELAGSQEDWVEKYIPNYIRKLEENRLQHIQEAERLGIEFVPLDAKTAYSTLSHVEKEEMRATQQGHLRKDVSMGVAISQEELERRQLRAQCFEAQPRSSVISTVIPTVADLQAKRARATRFGVPMGEQKELVTLSLRFAGKRRDPTSEETIRPDSLHIFGDLRDIGNREIMIAFGEFHPSRIEWLNGYSFNVVFADKETCELAKDRLCREIPPPIPPNSAEELTLERCEFEEELKAIIANHWSFTVLKDKTKTAQYVLVRNATLSDIKERRSLTDAEPSSASRKRARATNEVESAIETAESETSEKRIRQDEEAED